MISLIKSIERAMDWVTLTRPTVPRLEMEAERLLINLRRCRYRAQQLSTATMRQTTIGFYGQSSESKALLISSLAEKPPMAIDHGLAIRYSPAVKASHVDYPLQLKLLNETDIVKIMMRPAVIDEQALAEQLQALQRLKQPIEMPGISGDEMVTLWDYAARHLKNAPASLNTLFWPQAVALAPYLSIDDRVSLFSVLWGGDVELSTSYRQLAYNLQLLGSDEVFAQASLMTQVSASVQLLTAQSQPLTLPLNELLLLTAEMVVHLPSALLELVDIPGYPQDIDGSLSQAKRIYLLERYSERQELDILLVCLAANQRQAVLPVGNALNHWVEQTQSENEKPKLIWALTPFDQRIRQHQHYDDAVQRQVGSPGKYWGSLLVMDDKDRLRMVEYLMAEAGSSLTTNRINTQRAELQRELTQHLLGNWHHVVTDPQQKQTIAETLLKALQTRAGMHGELLERLLPPREALRRHCLRPVVQPQSSAFGIGIEIDLFADAPIPQPGENNDLASQIQSDWINHLRGLADNRKLRELLGISKPTLTMLAEELITASFRLDIGSTLRNVLATNDSVDQKVTQVLALLGDFVAWLGFQQMNEAERPASRIHPGRAIFAKPPALTARLTQLSATPTNNAASYIYDWLVGLNSLIVQNAGYSAGHEVSVEQRAELGDILSLME